VLGEAPNQLGRQRDDVVVGAANLLDIASTSGVVTSGGVQNNVQVAIDYLTAWLGGQGAVAINNLMEDAATAEIARSQLWQWMRAGTRTTEGELVTAALLTTLADDHVASRGSEDPRLAKAHDLFRRLVLTDEFVEFLTIPAMELLEPVRRPVSFRDRTQH
jgi:malate synthase